MEYTTRYDHIVIDSRKKYSEFVVRTNDMLYPQEKDLDSRVQDQDVMDGQLFVHDGNFWHFWN